MDAVLKRVRFRPRTRHNGGLSKSTPHRCSGRGHGIKGVSLTQQESSRKLCECGCGNLAPIANCSDARRGWIKGQPLRFCLGHHHRKPFDTGYEVVDVGYEDGACWIWRRGTSGSSTHRYGRYMGRDGRRVQAHVYAYEREIGPVPKGRQLDHLCRNTLCVNPLHLEPVTPGENVRRSTSAKLSPADVRTILAARNNTTRANLATRYGVSPRQITRIWGGRSWVE